MSSSTYKKPVMKIAITPIFLSIGILRDKTALYGLISDSSIGFLCNTLTVLE